MKRIRLATEEEVKRIADTSDLDATCMVLALDTQAGTPLAVVRTAIEVDPCYYPPDFNAKMIAIFTRDVETVLAAKGVPKYYFNVKDTDAHWKEIVKTWGAVEVSTEPEIRFKKVL